MISSGGIVQHRGVGALLGKMKGKLHREEIRAQNDRRSTCDFLFSSHSFLNFPAFGGRSSASFVL